MKNQFIYSKEIFVKIRYACYIVSTKQKRMNFNLKYSVIFILLLGVLSSCSTSNEVASNRLIQKRKYRKGLHFNIAKKDKQTVNFIGNQTIANAETSAKPHLIEQRKLAVKAEREYQPIIKKALKLSYEKPKMPLQILSNSKEDDGPKIEQQPKKNNRTNTITKSYRRKGKIALIFAWVFALMPLLTRLFIVAGFLELFALAVVIGIVSLVVALILGFSNSKMSAHAKRALLVVALAIAFWILVSLITSIVLGIALA